MSHMTPQQAIDELGGGSVTRTAILLQCTRAAIYNWIKSGELPELYQYRAKAILDCRGSVGRGSARAAR